MGSINDLLFIAQGLSLTLALLVGSVLPGFILGCLLAVCRYLHIGRMIIDVFISILRGTPLLLQLSLVYFSAPLMGLQLGILSAGIITFGINSSAGFAEILRAGIESIPVGQFEVAKTLQIPKFPLWKDIIFPQVLKNIFPALINETIILLKETALISTIGGMDLMRHAELLAAEQFTWFLPLCMVGMYYYCLVLFIEHMGKKFEKRGSYVKA